MNVELQTCSLVMLTVLLGLFLTEKSLDLTSRRLFFKTMLSCFVCLTLDILSIVVIYEVVYGGLAGEVAEAVCKLYVLSLMLQGYEGFLYAAGEFFFGHTNKRLLMLYNILFALGCLGVTILPIGYYMADRVVYSFGPSVYVAYAVVLVFILSSIYIAVRGVYSSSARRRKTILLWQGSWLLAAIVQFLRPDLLVAGFAVAFGEALTYAELENPHEGIDRATGLFTANALVTYLDDLYQHGTPFAAMHVRVVYRTEHVDPSIEQGVMLRIARHLNKDKYAYVFRLADDELVATYSTEERMRAGYEFLASAEQVAVDFPAKLNYMLVPDATIAESSDELMRLLHHVERDSQGQDCVTVGQQAKDDMCSYLQTQQLINAALGENRVEVFYQPIYNVGQQRFTSAEALVRIRNVDGSLVPPGVFIPVAEDTGLIVPLGLEIFRQVCEFLSTGKAQSLGLEYVEVNLSTVQFDEENPAAFVKSTMSQYGVSPEEINLEITETATGSARRVLLSNMEKLTNHGVSFSLDDFGTGRSNLDYFVDMPVSIIKFDYSFTQGYFRNRKARYVMEGMVGLMSRMGLPIVAEGVETEEQLAAMCELGISYIQGFYFSKPIPTKELLDFLAAHNSAA